MEEILIPFVEWLKDMEDCNFLFENTEKEIIEKYIEQLDEEDKFLGDAGS